MRRVPPSKIVFLHQKRVDVGVLWRTGIVTPTRASGRNSDMVTFLFGNEEEAETLAACASTGGMGPNASHTGDPIKPGVIVIGCQEPADPAQDGQEMRLLNHSPPPRGPVSPPSCRCPIRAGHRGHLSCPTQLPCAAALAPLPRCLRSGDPVWPS